MELKKKSYVIVRVLLNQVLKGIWHQIMELKKIYIIQYLLLYYILSFYRIILKILLFLYFSVFFCVLVRGLTLDGLTQ